VSRLLRTEYPGAFYHVTSRGNERKMVFQSTRDSKEQEIRERMARGVIGAEVFQEKIEKRVVETRRPKRGRPRK
jgi:REP element-mobilizing transposase RayT